MTAIASFHECAELDSFQIRPQASRVHHNSPNLTRDTPPRSQNPKTYKAPTMGWFSSSSSSRHHSSSRPGYARSYAGSSYSSSSRHNSSTSRYKRSPRDGYIAYLYAKFRELLRKLWSYARKHPFKVFFMVIMPLVSGGVLHKLARQFGVNLPEMGGQGARGGHTGGAHQDGYYGSEGYGGERGGGGGPGMNIQSVASGIGGLASLAKMAQTFM